MTDSIHYLVGSHVAHNHAILPPLLKSMEQCGIDRDHILVVVNGCGREIRFTQNGVSFWFQAGDGRSHFLPTRQFDGPTHWFFINGTSLCGPRFRELVESGYDPKADATRAGRLLPQGKYGRNGRAINDLAMYRADYLKSDIAESMMLMAGASSGTQHEIENVEGSLFSVAPTQASYPDCSHTVSGPTDHYLTGTPRITEYYPGIDWFRFKKNWGQLRAGEYDKLKL